MEKEQVLEPFLVKFQDLVTLRLEMVPPGLLDLLGVQLEAGGEALWEVEVEYSEGA